MVFIGAGRIGVARDIEPMASPLFAVARRREKTVDHFGKRVGRLIGKESFDFGLGGREADQIKRRAADQGEFRGRLLRLELLFFELR